MNRRDFIKRAFAGIGVGAVITSIPDSPVSPEFKEQFDELAHVMLWAIREEPEPKPEALRKMFAYSLSLPDNPAALLPAFCIVQKLRYASRELKAAVINSKEFKALVTKFGKYLA